jgi:hypothetical protein
VEISGNDRNRWRFERSDLFALAFITILVLWVFRGIIAGTHDPFINSLRDYEPWKSELTSRDQTRPESFATDPVTQTWAWAVYSRENLRNGDFPLWNTRMFSGTPFVANRLTGLFNPLILIPLILLPSVTALSVFYFIHYLLAAWYMYLFLKSLGISRPAAVFGSIAFIFQGAYIPWMGWIVADKAYVPMTLYYLQRILDRRDRTGVIGYIVSFYLLSVTSYPQMVSFAVYIGAAWVLFTRGTGIKAAIGRISGLAIILVLTFLLGAMQHLPMVELYRQSLRALPQFASEMVSPSPFERYENLTGLLAIAFPRLWGDWISYASGPLPVQVLAVFNHAYIGILSVAGFLMAPMVWRNRYARFFTVLSLIGLTFLAWPQFYSLATKIFPGFRVSGIKPDFLAFTFMIIVASFSLDHLIGNLRTDPALARKFIAAFGWSVGILVVLTILLLAGKIVPGPFPDASDPRIMSALWELLFVWLAGFLLYLHLSRGLSIKWTIAGILAILIIDLVPYHDHFVPLIPKGRTCFKTPGIEFLQEKMAQDGPFRIFRDRFFVLMPNTPMLYDLDEIGGFDSFVSADYGMFFRHVGSDMLRTSRHIDMPDNYDAYRLPFWSFLNVRYIISPDPMPSLPESWRPAWEGEVFVYENTDWLPRWFLVERVILVGSIEDGYDAALNIDPSVEAVVVQSEGGQIPAELLESNPNGNAGEVRGTIELMSYTPDKLVLNVSCDKTRFLVFSDTYFNGWRAWVDDREVTVYRTDGVIKGIVVPAGSHTVRFVYEPRSYKIGWGLFFLGLLLTPFSPGWILRLFSFDRQTVR